MIFAHVITDDYQLIVCGSFWPGAYDGAPPPDWLERGGPPIIDKRTMRHKPPAESEASDGQS